MKTGDTMTVDTNAPERIWATDQYHHVETNPHNYYCTEFIRLDLHEAAVRKARELSDACKPLSNMHMWTESADDAELVILTVGTVRCIREALE